MSNWGGKIVEIYSEEGLCLIDLDAISLKSLDDKYLRDCIEEGAEPNEYVFPSEELDISSRRDTDEELTLITEKIHRRLLKLENKMWNQKGSGRGFFEH